MFWPWKRSLSESRLWSLAVGGVHTRYNGESFTQLAMNCGKKASQESLRQWWDVNGTQELLATRRWLLNDGHRLEFLRVSELLRKNAAKSVDELAEGDEDNYARYSLIENHLEDLEKTQFRGWDLCRLVNVTRWGFTGGYIDEETAWHWLLHSAAIVQGTFDSWKSLGQDFVLGYQYWAGEPSPNREIAGAYRWLLNNPASPWRQLPFDLSLLGETS